MLLNTSIFLSLQEVKVLEDSSSPRASDCTLNAEAHWCTHIFNLPPSISYCPLQGLRSDFLIKKRPLPCPPHQTTHCLKHMEGSASSLPAGLLSLQDFEKSEERWLIDKQNRSSFVTGILPLSTIIPYYNPQRICWLVVSIFLRMSALIEPSRLQNEWESNLLAGNLRMHIDEWVNHLLNIIQRGKKWVPSTPAYVNWPKARGWQWITCSPNPVCQCPNLDLLGMSETRDFLFGLDISS